MILAHGSRDPRSAATVHSLVKCLREMRDDLRIEASFLDHCPPTPYQVIGKLAAEGVEEVVVLPLLLSAPSTPGSTYRPSIDEARSRFPDLRIIASDVLGYDDTLLDVLDRRMRAELKDGRVRELDALVLAAAGSSDPQANASRHPPRPAVGSAPQAAGHRRLRLRRDAVTGRGRTPVATRGPPPRRGRLVLPGPRRPAGPGRIDVPQGRRGRRLAAPSASARR